MRLESANPEFHHVPYVERPLRQLRCLYEVFPTPLKLSNGFRDLGPWPAASWQSTSGYEANAESLGTIELVN